MRKLTEEFTIDASPIPAPDAGVEVSYQDLDSQAAGRDEAGFMHRSVLRHKVRTWGLSYAWVTAEEYEYLRGLLFGKATFHFKSPQGECTAYCAQVGIAYRHQGLYKNLKFNIIEC